MMRVEETQIRRQRETHRHKFIPRFQNPVPVYETTSNACLSAISASLKMSNVHRLKFLRASWYGSMECIRCEHRGGSDLHVLEKKVSIYMYI